MTRHAPASADDGGEPVDLSAVDKLVDLAAEERKVAGYLDRAKNLREEFKPSVFEKVCAEYRDRLQLLGRKAAPLRAEALEQYRKLLAISEQLASTRNEVEQRRQEKELRRKVGELTDQECAAEMGEIERLLKSQSAEAARIERTKQRFHEVYPDVASVAVGSQAPDETPRAQPVPVPAAPAPPPVRPWNKTRVVPRARLVREGGGEYSLGAEMTIGREERNQIHLDEQAVSRKHASIRLTPEGEFEIQDEDSHFGTFVNEERIERRVLADGDVIRIGSVRLTYQRKRSPGAT